MFLDMATGVGNGLRRRNAGAGGSRAASYHVITYYRPNNQTALRLEGLRILPPLSGYATNNDQTGRICIFYYRT